MWTDKLTNDELRILGDALRQRRVHMGECLNGSKNKPTAHEYWKTNCGVLDLLLQVVDAEVDKRTPHSQPLTGAQP